MTDSPEASDRGRQATSPAEIPAPGWRDIALRVKDEFREDHVTLTGAGVAFFWFVALVPLMAAGVSLYGLVTEPAQVTKLIESAEGALPAEVANLLTEQLTSIAAGSTGALGFGFVIALALSLWSGSAGVGNLIEAINIAYEEEETRPFWKKRLLALGLTVGLLVVAAAAAALLGWADTVEGVGWSLLAWIGVLVLMTLTVSVLYRWGPNRDDAEWEWISLGAILAVVLWAAGSAGFAFYVDQFGSYNETYGSLGAIVVTLLWLWITALAIILGAEVNAEIESQTAHDTTEGPEEPMGQRGAVVADELGRIPE